MRTTRSRETHEAIALMSLDSVKVDAARRHDRSTVAYFVTIVLRAMTVADHGRRVCAFRELVASAPPRFNRLTDFIGALANSAPRGQLALGPFTGYKCK